MELPGEARLVRAPPRVEGAGHPFGAAQVAPRLLKNPGIHCGTAAGIAGARVPLPRETPQSTPAAAMPAKDADSHPAPVNAEPPGPTHGLARSDVPAAGEPGATGNHDRGALHPLRGRPTFTSSPRAARLPTLKVPALTP